MLLYQEDCISALEKLDKGSVDMVCADPPYGTTYCAWDSLIDLDALWAQLIRVCKKNAAIVMTAAQPFSTTLINSNRSMFRYDLVWIKTQPTGFLNANRMPLRAHEDILVFYKKLPNYNPQKTMDGKPYKTKRGGPSDIYLGKDLTVSESVNGERFPLSWKKYAKDKEKLHSTQKPVELMTYLIKSYTNEGDVVLDFCMGSGSTGVAATQCGRDFIGIEIDKDCFDVAKRRILGE